MSIFEKYYANIVPAAIIPVVKTALFVQDIGKSFGRDHQEQNNEIVGWLFLRQLGLSSADAHLVAGLNKASAYAYEAHNGRPQKRDELLEKLIPMARRSGVGEDMSDAQVRELLWAMTEVLSICDGAAYTVNARFKRDGQRVRLRPEPSFDSSFTTTTSRIKRTAA